MTWQGTYLVRLDEDGKPTIPFGYDDHGRECALGARIQLQADTDILLDVRKVDGVWCVVQA